MMRDSFKLNRFLLVAATLLAILLLTQSAFGQCSMCRAALAGSNNAAFIRNFNIGVLVLLVPPVTIFCSIFLILKRNNKVDSQESEAKRPDSKP
jgi:hypothetical protein